MHSNPDDTKNISPSNEDIQDSIDNFRILIQTEPFNAYLKEIENYKSDANKNLIILEIQNDITNFKKQLTTMDETQKQLKAWEKKKDDFDKDPSPELHGFKKLKDSNPYTDDLDNTKSRFLFLKKQFFDDLKKFQNNIPDYKTQLSRRRDTLSSQLWKAIDSFLRLIGKLKKDQKSTYGVRGAKVAEKLGIFEHREEQDNKKDKTLGDIPLKSMGQKGKI